MPDLLLTSAETASLRPLAEAIIRATGGWPAPDGTPVPDSLTPGRRREELLLARIKEEGGLWTGARAASAIYLDTGMQVTAERGVQVMLKMRDRGVLVIANPPRGRTFQLPAGPADPPWAEWTTRQRRPDGAEEINDPVSERQARTWMGHPETGHVALLRRTITPGPWIDVPVDQDGNSDA